MNWCVFVLKKNQLKNALALIKLLPEDTPDKSSLIHELCVAHLKENDLEAILDLVPMCARGDAGKMLC